MFGKNLFYTYQRNNFFQPCFKFPLAQLLRCLFCLLDIQPSQKRAKKSIVFPLISFSKVAADEYIEDVRIKERR